MPRINLECIFLVEWTHPAYEWQSACPGGRTCNETRGIRVVLRNGPHHSPPIQNQNMTIRNRLYKWVSLGLRVGRFKILSFHFVPSWIASSCFHIQLCRPQASLGPTSNTSMPHWSLPLISAVNFTFEFGIHESFYNLLKPSPAWSMNYGKYQVILSIAH